VCLADQHDVRPAQAVVQRLQLHQQSIGEHRPGLDGERSEIDRNASCRLIERGKNLREPRHLVRVAEHVHLARHLHLAGFGIDDAALITVREELFEQTVAQRSLAAAVGSVHEQ